jgi:hypothetical protein
MRRSPTYPFSRLSLPPAIVAVYPIAADWCPTHRACAPETTPRDFRLVTKDIEVGAMANCKAAMPSTAEVYAEPSIG